MRFLSKNINFLAELCFERNRMYSFLLIAFTLLLIIGVFYFLKIQFIKRTSTSEESVNVIRNSVELAYFSEGLAHAYRIVLVNLIQRKYLVPSKKRSKVKYTGKTFAPDSTSPYGDHIYAYCGKDANNKLNRAIYVKDLLKSRNRNIVQNSISDFQETIEQAGLVVPDKIMDDINYFKFVGILSIATVFAFVVITSASFGMISLLILACVGLIFGFSYLMKTSRLTPKGEKAKEKILKDTAKFNLSTNLDDRLMYLAVRDQKVMKSKYNYLF